MKILFQHLIILLIVLALNNTTIAVADIYLEQKDDGNIVELKQGDTLIITLDANPSTGYSWYVVETNLSILKNEKKEFQPDSNLLGAPGKEILHFTALENGETKLVLGYLRLWEKGKQPLRSFSVTVKVTGTSSASPHPCSTSIVLL